MRTYVIAEAGSNWRMGTTKRDLAMAKRLIDVAIESGADAVKFQTYKPETVYVENAGKSEYLAESGLKDDIKEIFKDLSMPYSMIPELAAYCERGGIAFMSTPFSVSDARAIDPYVRMHKIASYEITHAPLVEYLAKTGKPLIMSTGCADYDDISWAVNYFKECGGSTLKLMQCTAKYPAPIETINLLAIQDLINRFGVEVGLSDHSRDPLTAPLGAVAVGASVVEKHFTLHNALPGPDHSFAVRPEELKSMVLGIRNVEKALGKGQKRVLREEEELRRFAQRGVQAVREIKQGEVLKLGFNIDVLRPGVQKKGVHPKFLSEINGKKSNRDIGIGEGVDHGDWC
jgi:N-acetylneuraminate synthase